MIIGIDEAGRGPLAGPLSVGAVCFRDPKYVRGVTDSKIMNPLSRDLWRRRIERLEEEGIIATSVVFISASQIDRWGMSKALHTAVRKCLKELGAEHDTEILLDGSLYAPSSYINQTTIVKGDLLEPAISAASILAKVKRDEYMERISRKYPEYSFEIHKGYGTLSHRNAIKEHGLCPLHRESFCGNITCK